MVKVIYKNVTKTKEEIQLKIVDELKVISENAKNETTFDSCNRILDLIIEL